MELIISLEEKVDLENYSVSGKCESCDIATDSVCWTHDH